MSADAPWDFEIFERGTLAEAQARLEAAEADGVLTVLPQTPTTGAEIAGLALSQSLTDREIEAVRDALLIHKAIFFRAQNIDHDTHVAVAERFGELIVGHISLGHVPDHREIFALKAKGRERDPSKPRTPRPRQLQAPYSGW